MVGSELSSLLFLKLASSDSDSGLLSQKDPPVLIESSLYQHYVLLSALFCELSILSDETSLLRGWNEYN